MHTKSLNDGRLVCNLVPQGLFAPASNARSLDMGMIDAGQGDRINIMVEQGNVVFSWEATNTFELLVRDNLTTGDWTPVAVAPTVEGNQYTVTLPLEAGVRFFRLRNP